MNLSVRFTLPMYAIGEHAGGLSPTPSHDIRKRRFPDDFLSRNFQSLCSGKARSGKARSGQARSGKARSGKAGSGQVRCPRRLKRARKIGIYRR